MPLLRPRESQRGRMLTTVAVRHRPDRDKELHGEALVDAGAFHPVLPTACRERLGPFENVQVEQPEMADQSVIEGEICGPAGVQIAGSPAVSSEVLFLDMESEASDYDALRGRIPLEPGGPWTCWATAWFA